MYDKGRAGVLAKDESMARHWYKKAAARGNKEAKEALARLQPEEEKEKSMNREELIDAAGEGNRLACFQLGYRYFNGDQDFSQDYPEAYRWFEEAVRDVAPGEEHGPSCYYLGRMSYHGYGVPQDMRQAVHWFTKAAQQDEGEAMRFLAIIFGEGKGTVEKDDMKSLEWYARAAEVGNQPAKDKLLAMFSKEVVDLWIKACQGHVELQYQLALKYDHGRLVPVDHQKAIHWYQQAMPYHPSAATNLGAIFEQGQHGSPVQMERALQCYKMAAEMGDPWPMKNIGTIYLLGKGGTEKNEFKAAEWLGQACSLGQVTAKSKLRELLGDKGTEIYLAAVCGEEWAQYCVASRYETGGFQGMPLNLRVALTWYEKAARQGLHKAQAAVDRVLRLIEEDEKIFHRDLPPFTPQQGWPLSRFVHATLSQFFLCRLCRCVFYDAVALPCGHLFCDACIRTALAHQSGCPADQKTATVDDIKVSTFHRTRVGELVAHCRWQERGCGHKAVLAQIHVHETSQCEFREVACRYCGEMMAFEGVAKHADQCPKRAVMNQAL
eukprot:TRINITY_DN4573_c0_g1_i1.p1 TRINITY_DN4573_c0_g1~~TRINITY_DN4573_c0_g1_i1.p1  ORF type:complete len:617 (-),score=131.35 TRINITY_DN4573_c0_g1_i1:634-2283(-)